MGRLRPLPKVGRSSPISHSRAYNLMFAVNVRFTPCLLNDMLEIPIVIGRTLKRALITFLGLSQLEWVDG